MKMREGQEVPWFLDWDLDQGDLKAFRALVCGKAGVGKSTLINEVFGLDLVSLSCPLPDFCLEEKTQESSGLSQGVHNIDVAFESDNHPGLLIHDSCGYQAG